MDGVDGGGGGCCGVELEVGGESSDTMESFRLDPEIYEWAIP